MSKITGKLTLKNGLILCIEEDVLSDDSVVYNVAVYKETKHGLRNFATNYESVDYSQAEDVRSKMADVFDVLSINL